MKTKWTVTDVANATYLPPVEFKDSHGEWHVFELLQTGTRIAFGGACNVGFLESGYIARDPDERTDDCLSDLIADLETYYNDGPQYVSRIVCNERM